MVFLSRKSNQQQTLPLYVDTKTNADFLKCLKYRGQALAEYALPLVLIVIATLAVIASSNIHQLAGQWFASASGSEHGGTGGQLQTMAMTENVAGGVGDGGGFSLLGGGTNGAGGGPGGGGDPFAGGGPGSDVAGDDGNGNGWPDGLEQTGAFQVAQARGDNASAAELSVLRQMAQQEFAAGANATEYGDNAQQIVDADGDYVAGLDLSDVETASQILPALQTQLLIEYYNNPNSISAEDLGLVLGYSQDAISRQLEILDIASGSDSGTFDPMAAIGEIIGDGVQISENGEFITIDGINTIAIADANLAVSVRLMLALGIPLTLDNLQRMLDGELEGLLTDEGTIAEQAGCKNPVGCRTKESEQESQMANELRAQAAAELAALEASCGDLGAESASLSSGVVCNPEEEEEVVEDEPLVCPAGQIPNQYGGCSPFDIDFGG